MGALHGPRVPCHGNSVYLLPTIQTIPRTDLYGAEPSRGGGAEQVLRPQRTHGHKQSYEDPVPTTLSVYTAQLVWIVGRVRTYVQK